MNSINRTPTTRLRLIAATLSALAAACAATPTSAAVDATLSVAVGYGDLELARPADAAELYRRIQTAAVRVCSRVDIPGSALARIHGQLCTHKAIEAAVLHVDSPALITVYNAHNRPALPMTVAAQGR